MRLLAFYFKMLVKKVTWKKKINHQEVTCVDAKSIGHESAA